VPSAVEQPAQVTAPAPAAKPVAATVAQPERASANQARILGRVEIPMTPEPRPARREPGRPGPGGERDRAPRPPGNGDFRGPRTPGTADNRTPRPTGPARDGAAPRDTAPRPAGSRPVQLTPVEMPIQSEERRKQAPAGRKGPAGKDAGDAARAKKGPQQG